MNYLEKHNQKKRKQALKNYSCLFIVLGGIFIFLGSWNYYLSLSRFDILWQAMISAGILLAPLAVVCPAILEAPYKAFSLLTQRVGSLIFALLISIIYFVVISPFGALIRHRKSVTTFYDWNGKDVDSNNIIWRDKPLQEQKFDIKLSGQKKRNFNLTLFYVLAFFLNKRHWLIIPSIVILMVIGIVFFFIQSSALAPLIYTLF